MESVEKGGKASKDSGASPPTRGEEGGRRRERQGRDGGKEGGQEKGAKERRDPIVESI